ncbi:unnamed protein product [Darwinula stevensoni]|uniref:Uncharacterized protein n=1 Tax=Darwinula stevensoni TaxID=69355 RepID=A0A7R8XCR2_9CRUS|nr:unnamed protein product [Darwinula stevensoni]CAG0887841.1 unnamed protein product [Darwinula stevensoni]
MIHRNASEGADERSNTQCIKEGKYAVGSITEHRCDDHYVLRGSRFRTCAESGKWTGNVPFCERAPPIMKDCYCGLTPRPAVGTGNETEKEVLAEGETVPGSWPWTAALKTRDGEFVCGGPSSTVTPEDPDSFYVSLGDHDRLRPEAGQLDVKIGQIVIHPAFDIDTHRYDLAVVLLDDPAPFLNYPNIRPICLPKADEHFDETIREGVVVGWGLPQRGGLKVGPLPRKERMTIVHIFPPEICSKVIGSLYDEETMICASSREGRVCNVSSPGAFWLGSFLPRMSSVDRNEGPNSSGRRRSGAGNDNQIHSTSTGRANEGAGTCGRKRRSVLEIPGVYFGRSDVVGERELRSENPVWIRPSFGWLGSFLPRMSSVDRNEGPNSSGRRRSGAGNDNQIHSTSTGRANGGLSTCGRKGRRVLEIPSFYFGRSDVVGERELRSENPVWIRPSFGRASREEGGRDGGKEGGWERDDPQSSTDHLIFRDSHFSLKTW